MLIVFGIVLPLIAWITTRPAIPLSISIQSGAPELIVLVAYVVAVSLYLIGGPQWIDQHLPSAWTESQQIKFVITLAKKLFVFVAIPFRDLSILFRLSSSRFWRSARRFARARAEVIYWLFLLWVELSLLFNISSAAAALRFDVNTFHTFQLLLGLPLCFIWLLLEVGLVEEFFFRALVQSQLAAAFKSEVSGIVLMSLIFGLRTLPVLSFAMLANWKDSARILVQSTPLPTRSSSWR